MMASGAMTRRSLNAGCEGVVCRTKARALQGSGQGESRSRWGVGLGVTRGEREGSRRTLGMMSSSPTRESTRPSRRCYDATDVDRDRVVVC